MKKLALLILWGLNVILSANRSSKSNDLELAVDQYIQPLLDIGSFSGTILVSKHGKIILNRSYGFADVDTGRKYTPATKSYLGSNSKIITAIAIMMLVDKRSISLNDSVGRFLPDFKDGNKITIHQLLTHTSGLVFDLPFIVNEQSDPGIWAVHRTLEEQISIIKQTALEAPPGTKVIYSNNNYRLLAFIIERVSGQPFGEFLREHIFLPCNMQSTGHDGGVREGNENMATGYAPEGATGVKKSFPMDWNNKIGHASIYSTAEDMQRLYETLFSGKLISASSLGKMCTGYATTSAGTYGYGLFVWPQQMFGNSIYGFNGRSPGFSSELRYFKESDVFIAILSNNYSAPVIQMLTNLSALVFDAPMEPFYQGFQLRKPITISRDVLDAYTGDYEGGVDFVMRNAKLKVVRKDNDLSILWQLSGGRESILVPQEQDIFLDKTFWATLRFLKDGDGKVNAMEYTSRGKQYVAWKK